MSSPQHPGTPAPPPFHSSAPPHILVTGGCGFIGSNLVPMLLERGYRVRVLDNLSVGSAEALDGLEVDLQVGDIRDPQTVAEAVQGVDGVVHLAAHTSVIDSQHDPLLDFEINARGTLNLLEACRQAHPLSPSPALCLCFVQRAHRGDDAAD